MLFESIEIAGLLSFGWEPVRLSLGPINVLIGPNASGKSNLFEILKLVETMPTDPHATIRVGGGPFEWRHKRSAEGPGIAHVEVVTAAARHPALRYRVELQAEETRMSLVAEQLATRDPGTEKDEPFQFFTTIDDHVWVARFQDGDDGTPLGPYRWLTLPEALRGKSVLATLRDSSQYPQLTWVGEQFQEIRVYQSLRLGPGSPLRRPQRADARAGSLEADGSNLAIVLNRLRRNLAFKKRFTEELRTIHPDAEDVDVSIEGGTVEVVVHERDLEQAIPATRLSDGTLRWMWLLCLLLDPSPPPLLCLEEPEVGLHPDVIPSLATLLREASERTQILVATHSETLVSGFTETPEAVVVCERLGGSTRLRRLERGPLEVWLKDYSLGHVWAAGELGGNRW